jgi:sirohydrochlorin ferrochelatase
MLVFLVCHGSLDPGYQRAADAFLQTCQHQSWPYSVTLGFLEGINTSLTEQIVAAYSDPTLHTLSNTLSKEGMLIPLFMGGGVHEVEDFPAVLTQVQTQDPAITLRVSPSLGRTPEMASYLATRIQKQTLETWILFAHGSRLSGFAGNLRILLDNIRACFSQVISLNAAFAVQAPYLQDTILNLYQQGHRQIGILPLFLFPGKQLTHLQTERESLEQDYPGLKIHLETELTADPDFVGVIKGIIESLLGSF